jgi:hypothetical protein
MTCETEDSRADNDMSLSKHSVLGGQDLRPQPACERSYRSGPEEEHSDLLAREVSGHV